jgi:F-type H+-transporting ATPase subunit b
MSIDWFTVFAQIINFLILIWLLKRLLFRPIINAMERREAGISGRLQQADKKMAEAETLEQHYQLLLQQLESKKDALIVEARKQAETEKNTLLQQLSAEMQHRQLQFKADMHDQQQMLGDLISKNLTEKALLLCRTIIGQLADLTLEQRIIDRFLNQLSTLPETDQDAIKQQLLKHGATFITSFQPDDNNRQALQDWVNGISPSSQCMFEQNEVLICGIALESGGRSWEWNVDHLLKQLKMDLLLSSERNQ